MSLFRRKPLRVNVLGAGPAGLLAAWAATRRGYATTVFSAPNRDSEGRVGKSSLFGCQYLHAPIPGLTSGDGTPVKYLLEGRSADYREKVYGPGSGVTVSPDEYGPEEEHLAWDLRSAYDRLWRWAQLEDILVSCLLSSENVLPFYRDQRALTINTIPQRALCRMPQEHRFITQDIWAMGTAGEEIKTNLPYLAPDFTVQCNGNAAPRWYRAATVFGYSTLEWPQGRKPPISGVAAVQKPLSTDCDCYTGRRALRVGRYGRWTKGVLVHTAYYDTLEKLKEFS